MSDSKYRTLVIFYILVAIAVGGLLVLNFYSSAQFQSEINTQNTLLSGQVLIDQNLQAEVQAQKTLIANQSSQITSLRSNMSLSNLEQQLNQQVFENETGESIASLQNLTGQQQAQIIGLQLAQTSGGLGNCTLLTSEAQFDQFMQSTDNGTGYYILLTVNVQTQSYLPLVCPT